MIRKLLILALGLMVGGAAYAATKNADAAHRTHHAKSHKHHAKSHRVHGKSHSNRKHTARASHSSKAAPRTGKATHRA